jgi:hypothetical protein
MVYKNRGIGSMGVLDVVVVGVNESINFEQMVRDIFFGGSGVTYLLVRGSHTGVLLVLWVRPSNRSGKRLV